MMVLLSILLPVALSQNTYFTLSQVLPAFHYIDIKFDPMHLTTTDSYTFSISFEESNVETQFYSDELDISQSTISYKILNYNTQQFTTIIKVKGLSNSSNFEKLSMKIEPAKQQQQNYMVLFTKSISENYMLPFNMYAQNMNNLFVVEYNPTLETKTYNIEKFMNTYWNQIKKDYLAIPFIPFLSECSLQKNYILLSDIISPESCTKQSIFNSNIFYCDSKKLNFQCISEQLLVENVNLQFWFNHLNSILFYIFPKKFSIQNLIYYSDNQNELKSLVQNYYDELIPVYYKRQSSNQIIVNKINIYFDVYIENQDTEIIAVEILGSYDENIAQKKQDVEIQVQYKNFLEIFLSFSAEFYAYIIFGIMVCIILFFVLKAVEYKIFPKKNKTCLQSQFKIILMPILRGLIYGIILLSLLILIITSAMDSNNLSGIYGKFDSNYTDDQLVMNNKGRWGYLMLMVGFFALNASLNQIYKISSPEQISSMISDHQKQKNKKMMQKNPEHFIIKTMNSHRKYLLLHSLIFFGLFILPYYWFLESRLHVIVIYFVVLYPFFMKFLNLLCRKYLIKDFLFISSFQVLCLVLNFLFILRFKTIGQFILLYLINFFCRNFLDFGIEIFHTYLIKLIDRKKDSSYLAKLTYNLFQQDIETFKNESSYEQSIYFSALIASRIIAKLVTTCFVVGHLTYLKNYMIAEKLHLNSYQLQDELALIITLLPAQIFSLFLTVNILKKKFSICMTDVINYNRFKFNRRKLKWTNDIFENNKHIHPYYREFEKFNFSSQLYMLISLLSISLIVVFNGLFIVLQANYIVYKDPILLIYFIVVWIVGTILSVLVSFFALKIKLYKLPQQDTNRETSSKITKYLKPDNLSQYLKITAIKDYFLIFNSNWIIENLSRIFRKEDFHENNSELLSKYKFYKSKFKKKQVQQKKRVSKNSSIIKKDASNLIINQKYLVFNKKKYNVVCKNLMYYWLFLSRQHLYLKNIISCVRKEKTLKLCEFCEMDVELETIEKKEFEELVNQYRILNVGKIFSEKDFLQFYRLNQQYITICSQCKEKKLHIEKKINVKGIPSKLMINWLIRARSSLLHKNHKKKN